MLSETHLGKELFVSVRFISCLASDIMAVGGAVAVVVV
jgi:hypothetical protein